jgi:hypothetical protein
LIDYFFRWANQAAAKQDAMMLADHLGVEVDGVRDWQRDHILPNVKAWRVSQDTVVQITDALGNTVNQPVHQYLAGWYAIIAVDRQVALLLNAAPLQFALDRDACNRGDPFVIKNNIGTMIQDVGCEPIFAGSSYPFGGYA